MAGPIIPYASGAMSRFGPMLQEMLRRNIPIAQQRVQGLLGGGGASAGPGMMPPIRSYTNNPYAPMGVTAPLAGAIAAQAGARPQPAPQMLAQNIGPVGRANATSGAGGVLDGITPDMLAGGGGAGDIISGITPDMMAGGGGAGDIISGITPDMLAGGGGAGDIISGITPDMMATSRASRSNPDADVPVPPEKPARVKRMQKSSTDYQSNSLPVLYNGKINWATDTAGYGGEDNYGGDAADFFRADALRMAVPGLLGM